MKIANVDLVVPKKRGGQPFILQPPLGLGYLASAVCAAGFRVRVIDAYVEDLTTDRIVERCRGSDLVGVTAFSCEYQAAAELIRRLRQDDPGRPLAMGGSHFTALPEEVMAELPMLNFGVVGEGERPLAQLVELLARGKDGADELAGVAGLAYRENGRVRVNPHRFYAMEELPIGPLWDRISPDRYPLQPNGIFSRGKRVAPLMTGRGCPFHCTFCASRLMSGPEVRRRKISDIVDEMKMLMERYGVDEFGIMDSSFLEDRHFVESFCEALIQAGIRVPWSITLGVRVNALTPEILRLMERAGCYSTALGIESGSDRVLADMNTRLTIAEIVEQVRAVRAHSRIRLTGFFIVGYPTEEPEDIAATISLSRRLPLDRANFFDFQPLPGTTIFSDMRRAGSLGDLDYDRLYIHDLPFRNPKFSKGWLKRRIRTAHLFFYLRPRILLGLTKEIRSWSQLKVIARRAAAILF